MPSQFEVVTAAAWLYFAEQQVDIAVIEVGLGGRLDATNVCDRPLVSVITSISREHWQRLGPTLADIAREKAGILKPGCPAVIGELPEEASIAVQERIVALGCPATWVTAATVCADAPCDGTAWAAYGSFRYPLALQGAVQLSNSAVAIAAIEALRQQGWVISDEAVVQGMAATRWPGRMQWMTWQKRQLLIDGAHNPAGAAGLRQFVDSQQPLPRSVHWVIGMMVNKDHADILGALLRPGDRLALVPVPDHNSADLDKLATIAWQVCPDLSACQPYEQLTLALDAAIATSLPNHLVVLCGSLYLIGHFLAIAEATHRQSSDVTG
jgi:dihydrofolate synthase/folylpolyglutamate synthase